MRPIFAGGFVVLKLNGGSSENQTAPSEPPVIVSGKAVACEDGKAAAAPPVVIRPIPTCVGMASKPGVAIEYHSAPSGPETMSFAGPGIGNSVIAPPVVIRPILATVSVNQSAPSGPGVMAAALAFAVGTVNSVMVPEGVMRATLPADEPDGSV